MTNSTMLAKRFLGTALAVIAFGLTAGVTQAASYTEDFEATFPTWESGWLGTNSDLRNYYCGGSLGCTDRGNNPDGLWPYGAGQIDVHFTPSFGAGISSLGIDVAGYNQTNLLAYDSSNLLIFSQNVVLTQGAFIDPGVYSHYTINSNNGISRFMFDSISASGNTSIDNVVVNGVPEPETYAMLLAGLGLLGFVARRRKQKAV